MFPKHLKIPIILLTCFALLILLTPAVQAQNSILPTCVSDGYCTLCDIMQLVINFGKFLLGIVGSLALLMFVYGGFVWLTSGGESGKIDAGKKILINSVIGVAITFFAWIVVSFVVSTLTAGNASFKWDVTLNCEPLPGLEDPDLEDRWKDTSDKKSAGSTCNDINQCAGFCSRVTQEILLDVRDASKGKISLEANKCHDQLPNYAECQTNIAYGDDDTLACRSKSCVQITAGIPYCKPTSGTGTIALNEECTASDECKTGLYCQKFSSTPLKGKCQDKSNLGEQCPEDWEIKGDEDKICNYECDRDICVPGKGMGTVGQQCTSSSQCQNSDVISCACAGATTATTVGPDCQIGLCLPKITEGDITTFCDGWAVAGDLDNFRCITKECEDGPWPLLANTGHCQAAP